jgi:hypothetical protein
MDSKIIYFNSFQITKVAGTRIRFLKISYVLKLTIHFIYKNQTHSWRAVFSHKAHSSIVSVFNEFSYNQIEGSSYTADSIFTFLNLDTLVQSGHINLTLSAFLLDTLRMSIQTNGCPYSHGTTPSGRSSTNGSCTEDVCTPCACSHLRTSNTCCSVVIAITVWNTDKN